MPGCRATAAEGCARRVGAGIVGAADHGVEAQLRGRADQRFQFRGRTDAGHLDSGCVVRPGAGWWVRGGADLIHAVADDFKALLHRAVVGGADFGLGQAHDDVGASDVTTMSSSQSQSARRWAWPGPERRPAPRAWLRGWRWSRAARHRVTARGARRPPYRACRAGHRATSGQSASIRACSTSVTSTRARRCAPPRRSRPRFISDEGRNDGHSARAAACSGVATPFAASTRRRRRCAPRPGIEDVRHGTDDPHRQTAGQDALPQRRGVMIPSQAVAAAVRSCSGPR